MTKAPKPKAKKPKPLKAYTSNLDVDPKAWPRFESAVDAAVKIGPMHRSTKKKAKSAKSR